MIQGIKKLLAPKSLMVIGIIYTLFITFVLLFPATYVPKVPVPSFDKIGHVLVFTILVIIWSLFVLFKTEGHKARTHWVVLLAFLYGIIIEVLQGLFFESRSADWWDVLANTAGILLGWLIFKRLKKIFTLKS